ncbi:hypothetical protein [Methylosinus sp. Sm6]|uniref:hypothetical protein n=1 Tax=Methylosinus sp. Sm6 TaxID=2866948 RepID=UPI001C99A2F1|nr:hypothetical protein [Methylosinus sp. Sm6]MBY6240569.1 hypothetical protein [Methylosinus sp. Sm6]
MAMVSHARLVFGALGLAAALAACAKPAHEIAPTPIDPVMFAGKSCSQLVAARARRSQALIFAGMAQNQVSDDDRMRTLGVPTPVGTLFDGDREPEVARLKGELHAIGAQMIVMNCGPDYR